MKRLTPGSVICFGSTVGGQFCVDTVFVVHSATPWTPHDADAVERDEAFLTCTAGSLCTHQDTIDQPLTLYRGATFDDRVEGMYSFVPAKTIDSAEPRFERPAIHIPEAINPSSRQSTAGIETRMDPVARERCLANGL